MPLTILTYIKEKFKILVKLLTIPRFYGPLSTVIFTVAYHLAAVTFGFSITLSWLWLFMVGGVFIAGFRAGLLCAAFMIVYAIYALPMDASRLIQLAIATPLAALLIGWQTRKLRQFYQREDAIYNGNAAKLEEALKYVREAKDTLKAAEERVRQGEDRLGNLLASVVGYKSLRKTIEDVQAWHADPENIKKLHEMQEAEDDDNG